MAGTDPKSRSSAGDEAGDPRAARSRAALRGALLRLIARKRLEKISLREISAEAGLSYPTLFAHYADRDALFRDLVRDAVVGLLDAFRADRAAPHWRPGTGVCAHILARRDLWQTLLTAGAAVAMRAEFIRHGRDLADGRPGLGHGAPVDVVSGLIAGGIFEIAAWWLAQDAMRPADAVGAMMESLVIEPALGLPRGYFADR